MTACHIIYSSLRLNEWVIPFHVLGGKEKEEGASALLQVVRTF